jgi:hypothetical protein
LPAKVWKDHQLLDLLYKIWGWNRYGKNVLQLTSRNVGSKLWLKTSRTKIGFGGTRRSATMKIPITCINPHPNHYLKAGNNNPHAHMNFMHTLKNNRNC